MTPELDRYRRLEVEARRGIGAGVLHPDQCPKLTLHGVDFAIPPLGTAIVPVFVDGKLEHVESRSRDDIPVGEFLDLLPAPRTDVCPTCGQVIGGELDLSEDAKILEAAFNLAARALLSQYTLSDGAIGELLAWSPDACWLGQLVSWAHGVRNG